MKRGVSPEQLNLMWREIRALTSSCRLELLLGEHAERIPARKFGLKGSDDIKYLIFLFTRSNLPQVRVS